jgi:hypothetical protein
MRKRYVIEVYNTETERFEAALLPDLRLPNRETAAEVCRELWEADERSYRVWDTL